MFSMPWLVNWDQEHFRMFSLLILGERFEEEIKIISTYKDWYEVCWIRIKKITQRIAMLTRNNTQDTGGEALLDHLSFMKVEMRKLLSLLILGFLLFSWINKKNKIRWLLEPNVSDIIQCIQTLWSKVLLFLRSEGKIIWSTLKTNPCLFPPPVNWFITPWWVCALVLL